MNGFSSEDDFHPSLWRFFFICLLSSQGGHSLPVRPTNSTHLSGIIRGKPGIVGKNWASQEIRKGSFCRECASGQNRLYVKQESSERWNAGNGKR